MAKNTKKQDLDRDTIRQNGVKQALPCDGHAAHGADRAKYGAEYSDNSANTHDVITITNDFDSITKREKERAETREQLKQSLLEQLTDMGLTKNYHLSLVQDYIDLWNVKNLLLDDIKERGVTVTYNHGGGQSGKKKNDSLADLVRITGQMGKILGTLGIRGCDIDGDSLIEGL